MEKYVCQKLSYSNGVQSSELVSNSHKMQVDLGSNRHLILTTISGQLMIQLGQNVCISIRAISKDLNISFRSVQHIIQQELGYYKVCGQWISRMLNSEQKANWKAVCLEYLISFNVEGNTFFQRIVAGDESRGHHWEP